MLTFTAPVYVDGKAVNLNIYRNRNRFVLGRDKERYCALLKEQLLGKEPMQKVSIVYRIYLKRTNSDLMNFGAIIDKYTQDALVHYGILSNDSFKEVPEVHFVFGGIDKANPRAEVSVIPLDT